jgi:hypothetical protein
MDMPTILPYIITKYLIESHQIYTYLHQRVTIHLEQCSYNTQERCFQTDSNTDGFYEKITTQGKTCSHGNRKECDAFNCFAEATTTIEVKAGDNRTIPLSLCNNCVKKFVADD